MLVAFRRADLADVPGVVALIQSAYRGDESRLGWTTEADLLDGQRTDEPEVTEVIGGPRTDVLVAELDGQLVGCCQLEGRLDHTACLGMLAVRPRCQRLGVGRAIVAEAERIAAQERSCSRMRITVIRQRGPLIAWYERLGYQRTGELIPFPYGNVRAGRPKVDALAFAVLVKTL